MVNCTTGGGADVARLFKPYMQFEGAADGRIYRNWDLASNYLISRDVPSFDRTGDVLRSVGGTRWASSITRTPASSIGSSGRVTVPAPVDPGTPNAPWWYDYIASKAHGLAQAGFTAIMYPPVSKTQSGHFPTGDGYGVFDQYDIGWKNQAGARETRFGNREQLQRSIAVARACGLDVYLDVVMHQQSGSNGGDGVYRYLGADGVAGAGRFPKHPGCFRGNPPRRPEDPVPVPADDFAFGDEFVYRNCDPPRYTIDGMLAFGDWLTRSLDVQGYRFDDTKGTWVGFVKEWMTSRAMATRFCVSEYFDGNPDTLNWWAQDQMGGRSAVYDFTLHWALQDMCDHGADMRRLDRAGYIARAPFSAVTFVDNPDTDLSPGEQIIGSKLLAYAFILTAEGYPAVYHKDYARGARLLRPQAVDRQPGVDPRASRQRHDGDTLGRRSGDRASSARAGPDC